MWSGGIRRAFPSTSSRDASRGFFFADTSGNPTPDARAENSPARYCQFGGEEYLALPCP